MITWKRVPDAQRYHLNKSVFWMYKNQYWFYCLEYIIMITGHNRAYSISYNYWEDMEIRIALKNTQIKDIKHKNLCILLLFYSPEGQKAPLLILGLCLKSAPLQGWHFVSLHLILWHLVFLWRKELQLQENEKIAILFCHFVCLFWVKLDQGVLHLSCVAQWEALVCWKWWMHLSRRSKRLPVTLCFMSFLKI